MELSVAFFLDKKIFFLYSIDQSHPHFEELEEIKTIILDGNLDNLK